MIGYVHFVVQVKMISAQLKSNQFTTIVLKPAHFKSGLFCWYAASSQLTKVSYLLYYSILYLSYQADMPEKISRNRPFHLSKILFYSKNNLLFNHTYDLRNIGINSYASQLKIIRKVPFLRVYNLLIIRILKTSAKKVLSWASKGRYFDVKRVSFQSQLSLNSSPTNQRK